MNHRLVIRLFWSAVVMLSVYYFYRGIRYRFFEVGAGETFFNKQFWFVLHIASALAPLVLGPLQFWPALRKRRPRLHRKLGKVYITASIIAGLTALYLGVTQPYEGSIVPVVMLSVLWLFMTLSAWYTIRSGNLDGHKQFVVRSYVLALTFVSLRILGDLTEHANLLFFIGNVDVKDTTYEWLSWVLPLAVCEFFLSWLPVLRRGNQRMNSTVVANVVHAEQSFP